MTIHCSRRQTSLSESRSTTKFGNYKSTWTRNEVRNGQSNPWNCHHGDARCGSHRYGSIPR